MTTIYDMSGTAYSLGDACLAGLCDAGANRVARHTSADGTVIVSTIHLLGVHQFETLVWGERGHSELAGRRYDTLDAAQVGHEALCGQYGATVETTKEGT